ncbi:putative outer-membrane efflux protein [Candidatus Kuenenia stuttgartiensis]|uniref:Putative outer-membrane efflux protein n=1 Tax=Kuenenia stuttgartiensis TaxID=174633 RepID=Q1Q0Z4_KUEST|nr:MULTISPECIES: TolC family protein [Kuenenia]MCL4727641.1 TolC family protein [Candidatus Kuenenia stuttgartiensis]MCZ7623584.1 TolC family protein [Candidatus Kuenenia sp.]QII10698.1 putative outer-membrane efflux protein [Candidatus Kuenenia stuttgartiensis]TVM00373.1 MAG: TolC family protein [Candidatus Kuenenia stuttgartiensis]CAJ73663.1 similar to outer-membrane efflux protein [Candidatus Kuenenia stuttgartiensis]
MKRNSILSYIGIICISLVFKGCAPMLSQKTENSSVPESYNNVQDTVNTAEVSWMKFFTDTSLIALIDTALQNNQELNITLQEIIIAENEVQARKGEYLPFVNLKMGAGAEKVGEFTRNGAVEENLDIKSGKEFPEPLPDYLISANVSWEVDIWKKLRNAKKAAALRYLSTIEGKNFIVTKLIAEISSSYYELMALDNMLEVVKKYIEIQKNALKTVKLQKEAAKATELAVRKFEAEVLKNQSYQYNIEQKITETENRINFLVGRFPQPVQRNSQGYNDLVPDTIHAGLPSQLLTNRPDIKQAELELAAAKLDVKVARARFYPSLDIVAGVGYQAFDLKYLIRTPESILYNLAGELAVPLINRNAIKATYNNANAKQIQAVYNYERTVLNAYIEVVNKLSKISNLGKNYDLKAKQVQALTQSITIADNLFKSARADYLEVLMTQRDALEAKMELIETKVQQMNAMVNIYQALGGGWKSIM